MLTELLAQRPLIEKIREAVEALDDNWIVLANTPDHFVIDGEDGFIAGINKQTTCFNLDLDEAEALVLLKESIPGLLGYIERLEKENAELEHRLEALDN